MSFLKDLLTLDVVTVTGDFTVKIVDISKSKTKQDRNSIDFDELFNNIKGKVESEADLRILAASRIQIDRDTYHFVSRDLTEADQALVKMHFEAVSAATEGRSATLARLMPRGLGGDDNDAKPAK